MLTPHPQEGARTKRLVRASALLAASLVGLAAGASAVSCSVINSFDPVQAFDAGAGGSTSSSSSSTTATTVSSSSTASSSSSSSVASSSGAGGADAGGPVGVILVAGRVIVDGTKTTERVFAVLDPTTGMELSRYPISIIAAAHDYATDLWYLFEASSLPPQKGEAVRLHVGKIDAATGTWTELTSDGGAGGLPSPIDSIDLGVLNDRLVYTAFDPSYDGGAIAPTGLAIVNTLDPTNPQPASGGFYAAPPFFGFIAAPNPNTQGGVVDLINQSCGADAGAPQGQCELVPQLLTIPADSTSTPTAPAPAASSAIVKAANGISAAWGLLYDSATGSRYDLVAAPPVAADAGTATILRYQHGNPNQQAPLSFTDMASGQFSGLAASTCLNTVVITDRNNKAIYAVPLTQPNPVSQAGFNDPPTVVYFEPVTSTIVLPFQPANATYHLDAYQLGGTSASPKLMVKSSWSPPTDIAVDAVAVRTFDPMTFPCP